MNDPDFPLHALIFAGSVPRAQVAFSSEPSRNLLCVTIPYIKSICCAYVLSLRRARSPQPHFLLNAQQAAYQPQKKKTENLKFRTDLIVVWSIAEEMIIFSSRLLKKKIELKIEAWSLLGFQTSTSISDHFG